MKHDLDLTFGEIFNNDPKAFLDQLIDIQKHKANRRKAEKWVDRLRLIDISQVPKLEDVSSGKTVLYEGDSQWTTGRPKDQLVLPLVERPDDDDDEPYIAVSWRWTKGKQPPQWGCNIRESFDYMIQRPGREAHKSQFPDHYFDRVIMYAQSQSIDRLWIDKECIHQEDDEDRSLGVQIMDAVYEGSDLSIGLLTTPLMHQHEIDLLADLLSGMIFEVDNDTETPKYWASTTEAEILKVQTLILRILSDARWSRGWIFQEDHLSSDRMRLMIPHSDGLNPDSDMWFFEKVPGHLIVDLPDFRKAVTKFCMANSENEHRWPISEMLGKAKQYNLFNKRSNEAWQHPRNEPPIRVWTDGDMSGAKMNQNATYLNGTIYPSTTLSILDDICHRDLEKTEDRIAIMANAAKFSKRLDISNSSQLVTSETYSLSAILLALILLNGEILGTDEVRSHKQLMNLTLRQYMAEVRYHFNAPTLKYEQSFINHCRLKESTITKRGVEAPGFLFKLLPNRKPFTANSKPHPLKLTAADRQHIERLRQYGPPMQELSPGQKFHVLAKEVIAILLQKLRKNYGTECELAAFIEQTLACDTDPPPPELSLPSTRYVLDNMVGMVQALIDGRELRLARLDGEPGTVQPSAIFIAPYMGKGWFVETRFKEFGTGSPESWVFTSWDNGWWNHGMERLASLEVAPFTRGPNLTDPLEALPYWDPGKAASSFLTNYGWVNGVWNIEGKRMNKYTFPIPGLTSPQFPEDFAGLSSTQVPGNVTGLTSPSLSENGESSRAASPPVTRRRSKRKRSSSDDELSDKEFGRWRNKDDED